MIMFKNIKNISIFLLILSFSGNLVFAKQVNYFKPKENNVTHYYTPDELRAMLYGLAIKGSGSGGGFAVGTTILDMIVEDGKGATIKDFSEAEDDKLYVVTCIIGSPKAIPERLGKVINAIQVSLAEIAKQKEKPLGGVLSVESGSVNSLLAIYFSKKLNLPLLDVDGAGRSVPTTPNVVYPYINKVDPLVVATNPDNPKEVVTLNETDPAKLEEQILAIADKFGGMACVALWPLTGKDIKQSGLLVRNPFSDAFLLGIYTIKAGVSPIILDKYLLNHTTDFIKSFDGNLEEFSIDSSEGFDKITLGISYINPINKMPAKFYIHALNEDMLATEDREGKIVMATAPHIITYLVQTEKNGLYFPITNGDPDLMKKIAKEKLGIHVIFVRASEQLYEDKLVPGFLSLLKKLYNYTGPIFP